MTKTANGESDHAEGLAYAGVESDSGARSWNYAQWMQQPNVPIPAWCGLVSDHLPQGGLR